MILILTLLCFNGLHYQNTLCQLAPHVCEHFNIQMSSWRVLLLIHFNLHFKYLDLLNTHGWVGVLSLRCVCVWVHPNIHYISPILSSVRRDRHMWPHCPVSVHDPWHHHTSGSHLRSHTSHLNKYYWRFILPGNRLHGGFETKKC